MRSITAERTLSAQQSSVWAVLADYPNIVDWNDGIVNSYAIGDQTEGVGAQRQTEIAQQAEAQRQAEIARQAEAQRQA
ncbi:MAG: hypothetical protein ACRBK7_02715, partial [Acidimicrobiales bacterium]